MNLTLENEEVGRVDSALNGHFLDVYIDGVKVEDILLHIDIVVAIKYYGITELLDTIGEEHLKSHLECL